MILLQIWFSLQKFASLCEARLRLCVNTSSPSKRWSLQTESTLSKHSGYCISEELEFVAENRLYGMRNSVVAPDPAVMGNRGGAADFEGPLPPNQSQFTHRAATGANRAPLYQQQVMGAASGSTYSPFNSMSPQFRPRVSAPTDRFMRPQMSMSSNFMSPRAAGFASGAMPNSMTQFSQRTSSLRQQQPIHHVQPHQPNVS